MGAMMNLKMVSLVSTVLLNIFLFGITEARVHNQSVLQQASCQDVEFLGETEHWQIANSTIPAEILWQRSDNFERYEARSGSPSTGFVATDNVVLYLREDSLPCSNSPVLIGLSSITGEVLWTYEPLGGSLIKLFVVSDGYVLINVSSITKLTLDGQLIWTQTDNFEVPFRYLYIMFQLENNLYFPDQSGETYVISNSTGNLEQVIAIGNIIGIWENRTLLESYRNQLEMWSSINNPTFLYSLEIPQDLFTNVELNPIYPFPSRHKDTLLLSFDSTQVRAYGIGDGRPLWESDQLYGTPTLVDDLLAIYRFDNIIELRIPKTGEVVAQIELRHQPDPLIPARFSTWIAGNSDMIFIRNIDTEELIAIRVNLSNL
jgi:hypothetical protein